MDKSLSICSADQLIQAAKSLVREVGIFVHSFESPREGKSESHTCLGGVTGIRMRVIKVITRKSGE